MEHINLYAQYLLEREDKYLIELENGFTTYQLLEDYIYLSDIYVVKEMRETGLSDVLEKIVIEIGKKLKYTKLIGSFCLDANNWQISKHVMKKRNYKFLRMNKESKTVYMWKEI